MSKHEKTQAARARRTELAKEVVRCLNGMTVVEAKAILCEAGCLLDRVGILDSRRLDEAGDQSLPSSSEK